jgi:hypothetical protein
MRLAPVLAIAAATGVGVLAGLPGLLRCADTGTLIVSAGLALGLWSALAPRTPTPDPVGSIARGRRALR